MKKETNNLQRQLKKIPQIDAEHYFERISSLPENSWFFPTNGGTSDDFSICDHLAQWNLVQKKTVPIWEDGSFRGNSIAFLYNKDLDYKGGSEAF